MGTVVDGRVDDGTVVDDNVEFGSDDVREAKTMSRLSVL
jgi:hypothetical protein